MDSASATTPSPITPPPRWLLLGLSALTVVAVGALSLALFVDDIEPAEIEATATTEPEVDIVGDAFDRPDADGLADPDAAWDEVAGTWAVQDGHAALVGPAPEGTRNLAVLPTGAADGIVGVTVTAVEPGWGVAFRVQDEANYLSLVARPDAESWSLERVVDGVVTETPDFLPVTPADGVHLEIRLAGGRVSISDGTTTANAAEEVLLEGEGIGLLAVTGENAASMAWDDIGLARG